MLTEQVTADSTALDLAREGLYRFLAALLTEPGGPRWHLVEDIDNQQLAREAAALLQLEADTRSVPLGFGELPAEELDLQPLLLELLRPTEDLRAEYDRVFGLVPTKECPPYETEYHPAAEAFLRSQQMADVAGFYRAFGLEPAHLTPERPDHVALELEFMAFLLMKKRLVGGAGDELPDAADWVQVADAAQRDFFRDHLAWWVPAFAAGLRRLAGGAGLYTAVARVLAALLPVERSRLAAPAPRLSLQATFIERPEEQTECAACPLSKG
jgi:TorA maturation chaperone TorD